MNVNSTTAMQQMQMRKMDGSGANSSSCPSSFSIFKKILITASLLLSVDSTLLASSNGEELFIQKCAICHSMKRPQDKSTMTAPPAKGIMFHMSEDIGSDEKILAHIKSFTLNPTKDKAICRSVRRFGLMPSQKENITPEELNTVAHWMIDNLKMTPQEYERRKNRGRANR
ncbi:MAG: c-type cytochrome [Campylobacterota bacterium]|nr:c-type cytochrome [Campylobacterota bacterium]